MSTFSKRRKTKFSLRILFILLVFGVCHQYVNGQNKIPDNFCISAEEMNLFEIINDIRADYDKKEIKISASLSYVAKLHADDLLNNHPDTSICGLSSWSDKGNWKACCYNSYVLDDNCMWEKPKELTSYPYRAYELVTYFEDNFTNDSILKIWSTTKEVLDMLLTQGNYKKKNWVCGGVGINKNYVSVWFGQRADPAAKPQICESSANIAPVITDSELDEGYFYLVFGSFEDPNDAKEALKRIKKNNFSAADILVKDGLHRVYLERYNNLKAAMFAKQNLPYTFREAWILKD